MPNTHGVNCDTASNNRFLTEYARCCQWHVACLFCSTPWLLHRAQRLMLLHAMRQELEYIQVTIHHTGFIRYCMWLTLINCQRLPRRAVVGWLPTYTVEW